MASEVPLSPRAARRPAHRARQDGDARWLVTSTPAGFEAFVRAVGSTEPQAPLPSPRS